MVAINLSATRLCSRAESCLERSCLARDFWAIWRKICKQIACKAVGQALCSASFIIHFLKYYGKYKNCVSSRFKCLCGNLPVVQKSTPTRNGVLLGYAGQTTKDFRLYAKLRRIFSSESSYGKSKISYSRISSRALFSEIS